MKRIVPVIICCLILSSCGIQRSSTPRRYQTMTQKLSTTLQMDQHQYKMGCTTKTWRNELIILSLQPMLGIEMVRIEATPDSVWLFDKMNHRYTVLAYNDYTNKITPAPSYKMIQDFISTPQTKKQDQSTLSFSFGKHNIQIGCTVSQREYNTLKEAKRLDTKKYKRVSLREVLPL